MTRTGGSSGIVSATLNLTNGSAIAPFDYQNTPITVNFADGETSKIVNLTQVNQGLSFNGISDYVTLPNNITGENWTELTIEAWVYVNASTGDFQAICSSNSSPSFVHLQLNSVGNIAIYTDTGTVL
ncbi:MAG: LamG-like jellyroll fold domain-containing protein, partial [Sphaerospermopsis kisseleviana]